jgi:hypothetical protein
LRQEAAGQAMSFLLPEAYRAAVQRVDGWNFFCAAAKLINMHFAAILKILIRTAAGQYAPRWWKVIFLNKTYRQTEVPAEQQVYILQYF